MKTSYALGCDEFLVPKRLGLEKPRQGIAKQVRAFAVVKPEAHFVKVGSQMLCANTWPRSNDPALEQRKRRLNRVGVNVAVNVDAVPHA